MGFLFGTSPAARKQAEATTAAAADTAKNDRLVAQAAEQSRETLTAQDTAARTASELLSKPQGMADVQVAPDGQTQGVDPATGRRRTTRQSYTAATPTSGIKV